MLTVLASVCVGLAGDEVSAPQRCSKEDWVSSDPSDSQRAAAALRDALAEDVELVLEQSPDALDEFASSTKEASQLLATLRMPVPQREDFDTSEAHQAALQRRGVYASDALGFLCAAFSTRAVLLQAVPLHGGTTLQTTVYTGCLGGQGVLDLDEAVVIMCYAEHHYVMVPTGNMAVLCPDPSPGGLLGGDAPVAHKTLGNAFRMALLPAHLRQRLRSISVEAAMQRGEVTSGPRVGKTGKRLGCARHSSGVHYRQLSCACELKIPGRQYVWALAVQVL